MKLYPLTLFVTILTLDDVTVMDVDNLDNVHVIQPRRRVGLVRSSLRA